LAVAVFFSYAVFFLTAQVPAPTQTAQSMIGAPDFTLMSQEGQSVRLSAYRGKKVVIIFYRGYW
jgi:cytochrome oxidase Cu insertion factor (SCO1/SenC/PrrC family)